MLSVWDSRLNFPGLDPECLEHLARLLHTNNWDSKSSLLGTLWKYGNVWSLLLSMRYASQTMEGNQDILFLLKHCETSIQGMGSISAFNYYSGASLWKSKIIDKWGFQPQMLTYLLIKKEIIFCSSVLKTGLQLYLV